MEVKHVDFKWKTPILSSKGLKKSDYKTTRLHFSSESVKQKHIASSNLPHGVYCESIGQ